MTDEEVHLPPWQNERFHRFLSQCRLQYPGTKAAVRRGRFAGYAHSDFCLNSNGNMAISCQAKNGRCELRYNRLFGLQVLPVVVRARIRLHPPPEALNVKPKRKQLNTIFQIHAKNFLSYRRGPFLRIVWSGPRNELHAVVRSSLPRKANRRHTLASPIPVDFFDLEFGFYPSSSDKDAVEFCVFIDHENVLTLDASWYAPMNTNFIKTGIYKHRLGGTVEYESLSASFGEIDGDVQESDDEDDEGEEEEEEDYADEEDDRSEL